MVSPYHSTGFYYAPVTKTLLGGLVVSSVASLFPLSSYRPRFLCSSDDVFVKHNVGKLILSKMVFLDPKDMFLAGVLLYHFRIFERRYGSRKFAGHLIVTFVLSLVFEIGLLWSCRQLEIQLDALPTGPFAMVFSLFVPYFCDIPRVAMTQVLGVPLTGKSFTYVIGLQMVSVSAECLLLMVSGVLAGLIHRWLKLGRLPIVPHFLANVADNSIGKIIGTPSPRDISRPIGATLDIQRQEQIELLEQHMMMGQRQQQGHGRFGFGLFGNRQNQPVPPPPPSEDQVQQLVDMGFRRENILRALQATDNNITAATNLLLHDS